MSESVSNPPGSGYVEADPAALFPFPLDEFQLVSMKHIARGHNLIVCAPTGSGKTAIAEYAIHDALRSRRRCFYTTPLKALSNQKFHDFQKQFGERQVGLLTGDTSVNRGADLVVMTTEVYRNMLYGTGLGEVERNLYGVQSVILDECHYMNDVDRGTVWEESIIYSPHQIQLIALSATVANAADLCAWISATHASTELVTSDYRPVPLQHYYFKNRNLIRLIDETGQVDVRLRKMAAAAPAARVRGKGPRGPVEEASPPEAVIEKLQEMDMLPAIYFVFSRRGCELAMQACRSVVRLTASEAAELDASIEAALVETPSLRGHPHLPFLYEGLAVHHAGLLPHWKALVERLYQQGLIKAVFATETLAAGVNMPARTTVISAISKYSGEGHRPLRASEFLQMSGRAGRRGMDREGHVVILFHPKESVLAAARLARAAADPLESNFRPSYGMVLNLLQRHSRPQCRELIERSFGQFLVEHPPDAAQQERISRQIEQLSRPLCPDRPGDLEAYQKLVQRNHALQRQAGNLGRAPKSPAIKRELQRLRQQRQELQESIEASPCHGCSESSPCHEQLTQRKALQASERQVAGSQGKASPYWAQFVGLAEILTELGYLEDDRPTLKGQLAASLRANNILLIAEVVWGGVLDGLGPSELAGVAAALVGEENRALEHFKGRSSDLLTDALDEIEAVAARLHTLQRRHRQEVELNLVRPFACLAERWASGTSWDELKEASGLEAGDLVRVFRRVMDMCRQLAYAPGMPRSVSSTARAAEIHICRDELKESLETIELKQEEIDELWESSSLDEWQKA